MLTLLIVALGILVYAWVLYPALMVVLGRSKKELAMTRSPSGQQGLPPVAVVLSAHNEEKVIGARIANLLALNYPRDRLDVYIGVDGGNDRTASIVNQWALMDERVHVICRTTCQGKTSMLKKIVEDYRTSRWGDTTLILFTDANTFFERDSLRRLVDCFVDQRVGGVCGRLVFEKNTEGGNRHPLSILARSVSKETDESAYWNLETRLKMGESRIDSCLGANGAIYAIRAPLFPVDIPDNTIVDDFVIGMKVREKGFRMLYEPKALAREDLPETVKDEWRRRIRIGSGAYQALMLCRACLSPRYGAFAWMFWSHKVCRWFTPHLLVLLMAGGCWLVGEWALRTEGYWLNLTAVAVVGVFISGLILSEVWRPFRRFTELAWYFCVMQAALLVGFLRFCRGNLSGTWARTERGYVQGRR